MSALFNSLLLYTVFWWVQLIVFIKDQILMNSFTFLLSLHSKRRFLNSILKCWLTGFKFMYFMPAHSEFLVYIRFPRYSLWALWETIIPPFSLPIFSLMLSSMLLPLPAMYVFIKGLVGFRSPKTNILLFLNSDLLWEVTFQDTVYFSLFVTCF